MNQSLAFSSLASTESRGRWTTGGVIVSALLVTLVALLAAPAAAWAFDRLVKAENCPAGVDPGLPSYDTIQEAVDASDPGDEIGVCPGEYQGTTHVDRAVSLLAIGHVTLTNAVPCLNIIAPGVRVRGFEFAYCEGGIRLVSDEATIENNIFHHSDVAITVGGVDNLIRNNLIRDSTDTGINVSGACEGTVIRNNTVRANTNFGISVSGNGCTITKNLVQKNGVGISVAGSTDGVISFNSASFNRVGIELIQSTGFFVTRNYATRNTTIDCFWDGFGTNVFVANSCHVETPPGAWD